MKSVIAATMIFYSMNAFSCVDGAHGFIPENNLRIGIEDKAKNNMTKKRFDEILNEASAQYEKVVKEKKRKLKIKGHWRDETVNAAAKRDGPNWEVHIFGGIARHPLLTEDALTGVVCHELGHHLGGAPRFVLNTDWASTEGQSDYFASLKCMKKIFSTKDNISYNQLNPVDEAATKKCNEVYKNEAESALCQRISMAGKSLAMVLGSLRGNANVAFDTPDLSIVEKTYDHHSIGQCRLDTYFAGALCDRPMNDELSKEDSKIGTCTRIDGFHLGVRPACWYKPAVNEI